MTLTQKIIELQQENSPFVLATVVKAEGSVPGKVGFKILVQVDGQTTGTVGGGALEKEVISESMTRLKTGVSSLDEYVLSDQNLPSNSITTAKTISMMCRGKVWIFYEVTQKLTPVYIFGGGHVGQALSFYLNKLAYRVILIDNRKEFANKGKNPYAHDIFHADYIKFCKELESDKTGYLIIMTHGHSYDYDILKVIYLRNLKFKYVGVIASKSKAAKLVQKLQHDLGNKAKLSNLYSPIGIDIGGSTDTEIALSIAAELQAIQNKKKVTHLSIVK